MKQKALIISLATLLIASQVALAAPTLSAALRSEAGLKAMQSTRITSFLAEKGIKLPAAPRDLRDSAEREAYRQKVVNALRSTSPEIRARVLEMVVAEGVLPHASAQVQASKPARANNGAQGAVNLNVQAAKPKAPVVIEAPKVVAKNEISSLETQVAKAMNDAGVEPRTIQIIRDSIQKFPKEMDVVTGELLRGGFKCELSQQSWGNTINLVTHTAKDLARAKSLDSGKAATLFLGHYEVLRGNKNDEQAKKDACEVASRCHVVPSAMAAKVCAVR